jgi:hypothetical protein
MLWAAAGGFARADVLELTNGGRIEGRLVDNGDADQTKYTIDLAGGGRLSIARASVARVDATTAAEKEYADLARTSPDTIDAHWKLARWCRDHKLRTLSQQHLTRILELDPDHAEARNLLGFRNKGGRWMTREDLMAARGMIKYEGRYVTRQHVELVERQKEIDLSQADWKNELERLRRSLTGRRAERAAEAHAKVLAIRDPMAAEALVALLQREQDSELKKLWIEVLAGLPSQAALDALVDRSLFDPDDDIRYQCLEHVIASRRPGIITPYVRALKHRDNVIINRAGAALGQIGDPEAMGPLIDALVTKHKFQVGGGNPGQQGYTFTPGGGSFNFGGGGPKIETRVIRNPDVLSALSKLAGTSFDYNQQQWRTWLAAQAKLNAVDVRRDE